MKKYIVTEEYLQAINQVLGEATHAKFPFSVVYKLLQDMTQLPVYQEIETTEE